MKPEQPRKGQHPREREINETLKGMYEKPKPKANEQSRKVRIIREELQNG